MPQLWSCSQTPVTAPTIALNRRLGHTLCHGSWRTFFHPLTTSRPSPSAARKRGISWGSSCRSASRVRMEVPAAALNPAARAAALPKLRRKRMPRTRGSAPLSFSMTFQEPSLLPSSTKITSIRSRLAAATSAISACSVSRLSRSLSTGITRLTSSGASGGRSTASGAGSSSMAVVIHGSESMRVIQRQICRPLTAVGFRDRQPILGAIFPNHVARGVDFHRAVLRQRCHQRIAARQPLHGRRRIGRVLPRLLAALHVVLGYLVRFANQDRIGAHEVHGDDVAVIDIRQAADGGSLADQLPLRIEAEAVVSLLGLRQEKDFAVGKAAAGMD